MSNIIKDDQSDYLEFLQEQEKGLRKNVSNFEGSAWDALGQFAWGFTDQALLGTLGVSDAVSEATKGDAANTWEEMIAGDSAGDWEELSDYGKGGYAAGAALGQIPSFFLGGLFTQGAIKGLSKVGGAGLKMAVKKSSKELVEKGAEIATTKSGVSVAKNLTDDVATKIIDDAYEFSAGASAIRGVEGRLSSEIYESAITKGLRENIKNTLKIADDEILDQVAKSTYDIITKNNPDDAFSLFTMLANKIPGVKGRKWAPQLVGAMGYDAMIGATLGTMRTGIQEIQRSQWNTAPDQYGEMRKMGERYKFDAARLGNSWLHQALYDGLMFAPMGAAQFVKGGVQMGRFGHLGRISNIVRASAKAYRPVKELTNRQLRAQLTAMDDIAGGYLNVGRGTKWESKGAKWWLDATDDTGTKEMRNYLQQIRREFVTKSPGYWALEFGKDFVGSAPRMFAGITAMHAPLVIGSFMRNGFSMDSFLGSMGESTPEIAANLMTAAYFTKRPHSFHTEVGSGRLAQMFETGKIQEYYGGKQSKLRKMMGGLNTFGVDTDRLQSVIGGYSYRSLHDVQAEAGDAVIKRAINSSTELNSIKEILSPYEGKTESGGADMKTSFNKFISDAIKNEDISMEDTPVLFEKLLLAEKVLETYNANTPNPINLQNISPKTAYDMVTKLSEVQFDGQKLDKFNVNEQIKTWTENSISHAVKRPQEMLKTYVESIYEALGIDGIKRDENGVIKAPELNNVVFGDKEAQHIFGTVYQMGVKNNWIVPMNKPRRELLDLGGETQSKLKQANDLHAERMHNLVYGEGWQTKAIDYDPLILANDSWHLTYNDYLKTDQVRNAYDILIDGDVVASIDIPNGLIPNCILCW